MKTFLLALLITFSLLVAATAQAECYSEGVRVGTIQKFSQKGLMNKSWEGELVMDGIKFKAGAEGGTRGGNVWKFSTDSKDVAKAIDSATMSGGSIALRYCQISPLDLTRKVSFDTPYIITQAVERK